MRERVPIDRIRRESGEELACARAGDEDRAPLRREVDDVRTQAEPVGTVAEPRLHPIGAPGRRREVPAFLAEGAQQPVVENVPGLVEREQVAGAAGHEIVDPRRERRIERDPSHPAR